MNKLTNPNRLRRLLPLLALLPLLLPAPPGQAAPADARPVVGLVLGGGGAKGASHVGVLQVLEEMQVPVDLIVGTSMGAIIGGLYAAGWSPDNLAAQLEATDWRDILQDRTPRERRSLRRKLEDRSSLARVQMGLGWDGFRFPPGIIQGQRLIRRLTVLTTPAHGIDDFDRLPIPFRAIATDIDSHERIVLGHGDLAFALRASMGIPGAIAPVTFEGRRLIDGGLTGNLAVDVARALGAEVLIVVDLGLGGDDGDALETPAHVMERSLDILMRQLSDRQIATLSPADILIRPPLIGYSALDFELSPEITAIGARAAGAHTVELAALAVDDAAWSEYLQRQRASVEEMPEIAFVRFENHSRLEDRYLNARLDIEEGAPLDHGMLEHDIDRLYGTGHFELVDYRIVRENGDAGIVVRAVEKGWGPSYVRFGLLLEDDFQGNNGYTATTGLLLAPANTRGGEWRTDLQIGEQPRLFSDFYQPIEPGSRWFVAPHIDLNRRNVPLFDAGSGDRLALLQVSLAEVGVFVGREIGTVAEIRAGIRRADGRTRLQTGPSGEFQTGDFSLGMLSARLTWDTLDSLDFPRHGSAASLWWERNERSLGADVDAERIHGDFTLSRSREHWTLTGNLAGGTLLSGDPIPYARFALGGLFNLSGLQFEALSGPHYARGTLMLYRRLGRDARLFGLPVFAGGSLEAGNAWEERSDMSASDVIVAGSAVIGADTPLGPFYLAAGFAEEGRRNFYLTLGRTW